MDLNFESGINGPFRRVSLHISHSFGVGMGKHFNKMSLNPWCSGYSDVLKTERLVVQTRPTASQGFTSREIYCYMESQSFSYGLCSVGSLKNKTQDITHCPFFLTLTGSSEEVPQSPENEVEEDGKHTDITIEKFQQIPVLE